MSVSTGKVQLQSTCKLHMKQRNGLQAFNWPGSVHDSRIWKNSDVAQLMINSRHGGLLVGDEGYAIAPWLLTPYADPNLLAEKTFNLVHARERVVIERCFGHLKRRFPILQGRVRLALHKVPASSSHASFCITSQNTWMTLTLTSPTMTTIVIVTTRMSMMKVMIREFVNVGEIDAVR